VLQFKPGVLLERSVCEELLERLERAVGLARREVRGQGARRAA